MGIDHTRSDRCVRQINDLRGFRLRDVRTDRFDLVIIDQDLIIKFKFRINTIIKFSADNIG